MNNKFKGSINGKGYYIALILCAAAIGISGYLYYRNAKDDTKLQEPVETVAATVAAGQEDDAQAAIATQPASTKPTAGSSKPAATTGTTAPSGGSQRIRTSAPLEGETVAAYAMDCLSYNETTRDWRVHNGVDIAAEAGTGVSAAADGTVYTVYEDDTMGMTVVIRHDGGYVTTYSSLAEDVPVAPGQAVRMGQTIGSVGQTALLETAMGDHLHFGVTLDDVPVDPVDFLSQA